MRKTLSVILAGILVTVFCSLALAEDKKESVLGKGMMQDSMMGQQGMTGEEGMMMCQGKMKEMCPIHGMMMKSMMGREMIATADGGVAVLSGNKLMKFDKDLNLVKEAEIKPDLEGIQKMMMQMQENCPMCKKMMEGGMMQGTKEKSAESEKTDTTSEHKTHH
jgi:hypothetical protein